MATIRPAKQEDTERICEINIQAFGAGPFLTAKLMEERHGVIGEKDWKTQRTETEKKFCEEHIDDIFVAEEEGKVVGLAKIHFSGENEVGTIRNNAVDPMFQGRGISTQLVKRAVEELKGRGAKIITVGTLETAEAALRIYEKAGFRELVKGVTLTMEVE